MQNISSLTTRLFSSLGVAAVFLCSSPVFAQEKPVELTPEQAVEKAKKLFNEADGYFTLRDYEKALLLYKESYQLSRRAQLLFNIGQCERYLKKYDDALKSFDNFLKLAPDAPAAQIEKAKQTIAEVQKERENLGIDEFKEGQRYYELGEFEKALGLYRKSYLISQKPELLFNIGQTLRRLKRYDEAIENYQNFLKIAVDATDVQKEKATKAIADTEAERPKPGEEELRQANLLFQAGSFEKALALYEAAYNVTNNTDILLSLGRSHQKLGRFQSAIDSYQNFLDQAKSATEEQKTEASKGILDTQKSQEDARLAANKTIVIERPSLVEKEVFWWSTSASLLAGWGIGTWFAYQFAQDVNVQNDNGNTGEAFRKYNAAKLTGYVSDTFALGAWATAGYAYWKFHKKPAKKEDKISLEVSPTQVLFKLAF